MPLMVFKNCKQCGRIFEHSGNFCSSPCRWKHAAIERSRTLKLNAEKKKVEATERKHFILSFFEDVRI